MKKIIVLLGKSASGKTTTSVWLDKFFKENNVNSKICIEDTTREPRFGEDKVSHNFIGIGEFFKNKRDGEYLYTSEFNNWYYGLRGDIFDADVNIIVVNPTNLMDIVKMSFEYDMYIYYLQASLSKRYIRSIHRDGFSFEIIRRMLSDFIDFQKMFFQAMINHIPINFINTGNKAGGYFVAKDIISTPDFTDLIFNESSEVCLRIDV